MAVDQSSGQPWREFERQLVALIPDIRAFARAFTGDRADGEDLAQEALGRAWRNRQSFQPGTNLKAWVFVILRNVYFGEKRRSWRRVPLDPEVAARSLVAPDNPHSMLVLDELRRGLRQLPPEQREALILVAAAGLSYEEAAAVCGVELGTVKSRLSRARRSLEYIIERGGLERDNASAADAHALIISEAMSVARRSSARSVLAAV